MSDTQRTEELNLNPDDQLLYYRSLLFTDMNPSNASILNALRSALDAVDELKRLKSGSYTRSLEELCAKLELENEALRSRLAEVERRLGV